MAQDLDAWDWLRLLFSELLDSSMIHFMAGWEWDKQCRRRYASAKKVQIKSCEL